MPFTTARTSSRQGVKGVVALNGAEHCTLTRKIASSPQASTEIPARRSATRWWLVGIAATVARPRASGPATTAAPDADLHAGNLAA